MVIVGLINPKSPSNVGGVVRAMGCFAADAIFYTGMRFEYARKFATDTKDFSEQLPLTRVDDIRSAIPTSCKVIGVELALNATALPDFIHPEHAFYLFGPEDGSLNNEQLALCDEVIYIPTFSSLNLAATVNVVLYDRLAKDNNRREGNELIRLARDQNNRSKTQL